MLVLVAAEHVIRGYGIFLVSVRVFLGVIPRYCQDALWWVEIFPNELVQDQIITKTDSTDTWGRGYCRLRPGGRIKERGICSNEDES